VDDGPRHTAQQKAFDRSVAAGADDDEIGLPGRGRVQEADCGRLFARDPLRGRRAPAGEEAAGLVEHRLGGGLDDGGSAPRQLPFQLQRREVDGHGVDRGIHEPPHEPHRVERHRRTVHPDQDSHASVLRLLKSVKCSSPR
jgi:hypothetical protein